MSYPKYVPFNLKTKEYVERYRPKAIRKYSNKCMECGSKKEITVHHIDGNRQNNDILNLQVLCKDCHNKKHIHLNTQEDYK